MTITHVGNHVNILMPAECHADNGTKEIKDIQLLDRSDTLSTYVRRCRGYTQCKPGTRQASTLDGLYSSCVTLLVETFK